MEHLDSCLQNVNNWDPRSVCTWDKLYEASLYLGFCLFALCSITHLHSLCIYVHTVCSYYDWSWARPLHCQPCVRLCRMTLQSICKQFSKAWCPVSVRSELVLPLTGTASEALSLSRPAGLGGRAVGLEAYLEKPPSLSLYSQLLGGHSSSCL